MTTRGTFLAAACATLLWAGTALGTTPQQRCDKARSQAGGVYLACVQRAVVQDNGPTPFTDPVPFGRCRHRYFSTWTRFQMRGALNGSSCVGSRFTDNRDGTVTDNLSGLIWEQKRNLDFTPEWSDPHDADNLYSQSDASTSLLTGVTGLNTTAFAGTNDWRLPTLAELQTILRDFACTRESCSCASDPCVDDAVGPTFPSIYWTATFGGPTPTSWVVDFSSGQPVGASGYAAFVRAVRGGVR